MTSTALTPANFGSMAEAIKVALGFCETAADAKEALAKVAAARAWAKAHGAIRDARMDLLCIEVAALVRVVELGGTNLLTAAERKAGEWLSRMSPEERDALIRDTKSATTAEGLCRTIWRDQEESVRRRRVADFGMRWASSDRSNVAEAMDEAIAHLGKLGQPFEVAEMAEMVATSVNFGDEDFMEGVREMCRTSLRSAHAEGIDGTIIPKTITSQLPDGTWVRIPTMNATLGDLNATLAMRKRQLEEDQASFERISAFVEKVRKYADGDSSTVAEALAESLKGVA